MEKAYLVFENGRIFEGYSIGAKRNTIGEAVFTTGMVGYLETLTDPSYAGQIVIQTFPQIGNYGVIPEDFEGAPAVRGYVVRDCCDAPSNFRSKYALDQYLKEKNIPGICGIDTRAVTRMLRTSGVMNASICDAPPQNTADIAAYCVKDAVSKVSTKSKKEYPSDGAEAFHVALIDYGAKRNIIRSLCARGCSVTVFPQDSSAEEILKCQPDGIMLSNGPGDPAENISSAACPYSEFASVTSLRLSPWAQRRKSSNTVTEEPINRSKIFFTTEHILPAKTMAMP